MPAKKVDERAEVAGGAMLEQRRDEATAHTELDEAEEPARARAGPPGERLDHRDG